MTTIKTSKTSSKIDIRAQAEPFFVASLPLPPGINGSYKTVRVLNKGSVIYRPGATEAFAAFKKAAAIILADYGKSYQDLATINAIRGSKIPLKMEIRLFNPTMWLRDIDGPIKAIIDAVFTRMELNDNLVVDLHVQKFIDPENPHCEIEISLLTR